MCNVFYKNVWLPKSKLTCKEYVGTPMFLLAFYGKNMQGLVWKLHFYIGFLFSQEKIKYFFLRKWKSLGKNRVHKLCWPR
jgi:hypothetical protein